MDVLNIFLTLVAAQILIVLSPGPNTVLVIQNALHERKLGFATALGTWPAGFFWAIVGIIGSGSVVLMQPVVLKVLYLFCGSYLVWLGIKAIRGSLRSKTIAMTGTAKYSTFGAAWRAGILSNITNPKTIAYYASIFTATGAIEMSSTYKVMAVIMMPTISFSWFCILTMLIAHKFMQRFLQNARVWLDRVAGIVMIGFGVRLLATLVT